MHPFAFDSVYHFTWREILWIARLDHYFRTYKPAGDGPGGVQIDLHYGAEHAYAVVEAAMADYQDEFGPS